MIHRKKVKCTYKSGYKYQLVKSFYIQTYVKPERRIENGYFTLREDGYLVLRKGYAWDGATGAFDTPDFIAASAVHDAHYQAIRRGLLPMSKRIEADKELKRICIEHGMSRIRADWVYYAVRLFGKKAALPESKKKIMEA